jgi:thymidylate kinase
MTHRRLIVAVEGPCCAGKTTLSRSLIHRLADQPAAHVVCYADHVGGGRHLPPPVPSTLTQDAAGLTELIRIERDRTSAALASTNPVILADRGLHTLLAHRHAIGHLTGLDFLPPAQRLLAASHLTSWPELVLYLDLPQEAVHDRNHGKFPADSIFINQDYNAAFRRYFTRLAAGPPPPHLVWLEATHDPATLVSAAEAHIRRHLPNRHEEDTPGVDATAAVRPGHLRRLARRAVPRPVLDVHPRQRHPPAPGPA